MGNIHKNFPTLFDTIDPEFESAEGNEETYQSDNNEFSQFGILPYVLKFSEVTLIPFDKVLDIDVNTVFYIVSYEVLLAKKKEKDFKMMQMKGSR